jgi:hypothetical protein
VFFLVHLLQGFLVEQRVAGMAPIREFDKIFNHYFFYGSFWWQFIAILPLQFLPWGEERRLRLIWLVKSLRFGHGMQIINASFYMSIIKGWKKRIL